MLVRGWTAREKSLKCPRSWTEYESESNRVVDETPRSINESANPARSSRQRIIHQLEGSIEQTGDASHWIESTQRVAECSTHRVTELVLPDFRDTSDRGSKPTDIVTTSAHYSLNSDIGHTSVIAHHSRYNRNTRLKSHVSGSHDALARISDPLGRKHFFVDYRVTSSLQLTEQSNSSTLRTGIACMRPRGAWYSENIPRTDSTSSYVVECLEPRRTTKTVQRRE